MKVFTAGELEYIAGLSRLFDREVDIDTFAIDGKVIDPNGDVAGYIIYDPNVGAHTFVVEQ